MIVLLHELLECVDEAALTLADLRLALQRRIILQKLIPLQYLYVRFRVWNTSSHVILTADYINTAVFCYHMSAFDPS